MTSTTTSGDSKSKEQTKPPFPAIINLLTATIQELQGHLTSGLITSVQLTQEYLHRIEANNHSGFNLRAVIQVAPYENVMKIAKDFDELRAKGVVLGELHGIPLLVKDVIATDSELGLLTTAGSHALVNSIVPRDATVISKLRAQGAIILGKANLTEFHNFKSKGMPWGWSALGGQTQSAYKRGGTAVGGSSSGSAVGVSAGFAAGAIGTETDGSLIDPSAKAAAYGIKASVGLIPRTGIVPLSSTADSLGPIAKSTYDVALLLGAMAGQDQGDASTLHAKRHAFDEYTQFTKTPYAVFAGKRLGIPRNMIYHHRFWDDPVKAEKVQKAMNEAVSKMEALGAFIQDPADIPSMEEWIKSGMEAQNVVLRTEFKVEIAKYLASTVSTDVKTLEDIIGFNELHADIAFGPEGKEAGQTEFLASQETTGTASEVYVQALQTRERIGRKDGLDKVLDDFGLDVLVMPTVNWVTSAFPSLAGYPVTTVPLGTHDDGEHFGLSFLGRKWSESVLIGLMAAYEANFPLRAVPSAPELTGTMPAEEAEL